MSEWLTNPIGSLSDTLSEAYNSAMNIGNQQKNINKSKVKRKPSNVTVKQGDRTATITQGKKPAKKKGESSTFSQDLRRNVTVDFGPMDPNQKVSKLYDTMMGEAKVREKERTKSIRDMMNEQQNILQNSQAQVNLRPTAQFVDAMTGSNFAAGYEAPTQTMKNMARVDALQGAIEKQKDGVFKERRSIQLAEAKSVQAMENARQNAIYQGLKFGAAYNKPMKAGKAAKAKEQKNITPKTQSKLMGASNDLASLTTLLKDIRSKKKFIGWGKGAADFGLGEYFDATVSDFKGAIQSTPIGKALGMSKAEASMGADISFAKIRKARKDLHGRVEKAVVKLAKSFEARLTDADIERYREIFGTVDMDPSILSGKIMTNVGEMIDIYNSELKNAKMFNLNTGDYKKLDKQKFINEFRDLLGTSTEFEEAYPEMHRQNRDWREKNSKLSATQDLQRANQEMRDRRGESSSSQATRALQKANVKLRMQIERKKQGKK